ncbi:MAG: NADH-quinone oxidoreductase subunit J [Methanobacteriota archaeon]|nr:MAG: NADH-quinone oxidoreductase subunit J [Euryarchaeota archaeon]
MDLYTIIFYVFALMTSIAASIVVFSKNIVHAAFALLFAFFGVAGIYVFLMADFLAVTQLLIYVGGITVLILFGVMLTNRQIQVDVKTGSIQTLPAVAIVAAIAGTLIGIFWLTDWNVNPNVLSMEKTAPQIGELLLTKYVLPFEIASVVLLVALIGAAMIARRDKKNES